MNAPRGRRARWHALAPWLGVVALLSCSVDQHGNAAYRACSEAGEGCGTGEHCHRGYCVPDDPGASSGARSGAADMRESPLRGGDTARASGPMSAGMGAARAPAAGTAGDGPRSSPADAGPRSGADAAASTPAEPPEPPSSSQPATPPSEPPPSEPPPSEPPPSEPPPDPPTTEPEPPAQCTPRPETCNRADEDCDGRTDEGFALQTDPAHCGRCGNACPTGTTCCGGSCLDLNGSPAHCGACGRACRAGQSCCGGTCVDTSREPAHCGSCGHVCTGLLQACCTGVCKTLCLL